MAAAVTQRIVTCTGGDGGVVGTTTTCCCRMHVHNQTAKPPANKSVQPWYQYRDISSAENCVYTAWGLLKSTAALVFLVVVAAS